MPDRGDLPRATVRRLPRYLRALEAHPDGSTIDSEAMAATADTNAAVVRRDLSILGFSGVRGVGYDVDALRALIRTELGLTADVRVAVVGAGNLGRALANYGGFDRRGFRVVALYDTDPNKTGDIVAGVPVKHLDDLISDGQTEGIDIGIVATPETVAQGVADLLAKAGVRSILNFAPAHLRVTAGVEVRQVDLSTELQILSYYRNHG